MAYVLPPEAFISEGLFWLTTFLHLLVPSKAIRASCLWWRSWPGCGTASSFISCFTLLHFWRIRSSLGSCPYFCLSLQVCLPCLCGGVLFDWVAVRSHVLKYDSAHWQWVKQVQARKGVSLWMQRRLECGCGCLSQDLTPWGGGFISFLWVSWEYISLELQ